VILGSILVPAYGDPRRNPAIAVEPVVLGGCQGRDICSRLSLSPSNPFLETLDVSPLFLRSNASGGGEEVDGEQSPAARYGRQPGSATDFLAG